MSDIDPNITHDPNGHSPADTAIASALHHLAVNTKVDPTFAAGLESKLLLAADAMAKQSTEPATASWGQRLLRALRGRATARPLRYGVVAAGLLLALILLSTSTVRATLWDWLYGTGLIAEQTVTDRTVPLETPVVDEMRPVSLLELQAQAPFSVMPPTWLPRKLVYTGGYVDTTAAGTQVTLAFHPPGTDTGSTTDLVGQPLLFMLMSNGSVDNRPLLAEEQVQPVQIQPASGGRALGVYAHGGWRSTAPVTPKSSTVNDLYWDSTADEAWLSWQMHGLNYLLYAQGLGVTEQEMLRIAESIAAE
ncbi:MAG: hypothetical protein R2932_05220 [Caldilineaceae bacterium]